MITTSIAVILGVATGLGAIGTGIAYVYDRMHKK